MTGALNTARSTSWGRSPGSVSETTPPSLVSQKPTAAPNGSSAPSKSNASGPNCTTPSTTSARPSRPGPRPTTTNGASNATATRPHEKHSPQPKARWQHETDTNAVQRTGCCSVSTLERESVGDPSDLNPAFFDRATRACRWVEGRAPKRRCSAPLDEDAGDTVPGQTVPQRRGFPACAIGSVEGTLFDRVGIGAHEPVGAHRDRDGPFGVLPQRQARDPED